VVFAKRGWRSGVVDDKGNPASELNLAYSTDHICWKRIPKPADDDDSLDAMAAFSATITSPLKAVQIVRLAAEQLQRGARTVWRLWDGGEGILGRHFIQDSDGLWLPKTQSTSKPYKDD